MNVETAPGRLPRRVDDVDIEVVDSVGAVLHRPDAGSAYELNETALALWELCDGRTTPEEMVSSVCALFDIHPAAARRDIDRTLHELTDAALVTWRPARTETR